MTYFKTDEQERGLWDRICILTSLMELCPGKRVSPEPPLS